MSKLKYIKLFENFDLIKEDNLDLKSIGKKLYSFLKSKGYVVKLTTEEWSFMRTLFRPAMGKNHTKKSSEKDSYHLDSDRGSITNMSDLLRKGIRSDNWPKSSTPNVIIRETGPDEEFELGIYVLSFYVDDTKNGVFGKRKVEDKEKKRELSKIISDFLSTFSTIEVENRKSTFDQEIDGFFVKLKESVENELPNSI